MGSERYNQLRGNWSCLWISGSWLGTAGGQFTWVSDTYENEQEHYMSFGQWISRHLWGKHVQSIQQFCNNITEMSRYDCFHFEMFALKWPKVGIPWCRLSILTCWQWIFKPILCFLKEVRNFTKNVHVRTNTRTVKHDCATKKTSATFPHGAHGILLRRKDTCWYGSNNNVNKSNCDGVKRL